MQKKPELSVTLVRRFPKDDVRRRQFDVEDAFSGYINGTTQAGLPINIPGDAPRFFMNDNKRKLSVSDVSAQLTLEFGTNRPDDGIKSAVTAAARRMDKFNDLFPEQNRFYIGLFILADHIIDEDSDDLLSSVFERVFKTSEENRSIFSFNIGKEISEINYAVEMSQVYKLELAQPLIRIGQSIHIDTEFSDLGSLALQVRVDVNTKPQKELPRQRSFVSLIDEMQKALDTHASEVVGEEIVRGFDFR